MALGLGGLSAVIGADGATKTLYWRGKLDKRVIRKQLGNYPDMTVADALEAARAARSAARNGKDPNLEERRKREGADAPVTVRKAAELFKDKHLDAKRGERWRAEAWRILQREVVPERGGLGATQLTDVTRAQLTALVDRKAATLKKRGRTGIAANRLAAVLGRFFSFCADKGWIDSNPAARLPKPVEEAKRERVLSAAELGEIWNALPNAEGPDVYSKILALLMLTGCRVSEIASLQRENVDLAAGAIKFAKGKTKDAARVLPVGPTARSMLASIVEGADSSGRLFSTKRRRGWKYTPDEAARKAINVAIDVPTVGKAARALCARLGHARWTPHDLRRTLISELHEAGFGEGIVRRLAGHTAKGVHDAVYDRSKRLESIRNALEHYENHVLKCAADVEKAGDSNVVTMRSRVKDYA